MNLTGLIDMIHPFPNTFVFSLPNTLGNYFHSLFLQFDPFTLSGTSIPHYSVLFWFRLTQCLQACVPRDNGSISFRVKD